MCKFGQVYCVLFARKRNAWCWWFGFWQSFIKLKFYDFGEFPLLFLALINSVTLIKHCYDDGCIWRKLAYFILCRKLNLDRKHRPINMKDMYEKVILSFYTTKDEISNVSKCAIRNEYSHSYFSGRFCKVF